MPCLQGKQSLDGHWYCHACWQAWKGVSETQRAPTAAEPMEQAHDTGMEDGQHRYKRWTMPAADGQELDENQIIEEARRHGSYKAA